MLTLEQQVFRKRGIGASEIAAVVGLNRWQRPIDVWEQKTGRAEPVEASPAMERGNRLEPYVRDWYADKFDRDVILSDTLQHPDFPLALATPDGISRDREGGDSVLLEIKVPTQRSQRYWGPDGSDEFPLYYLPQVQWAMAVTRLPRAHLVADVYDEIRCYPVEYDDELFRELLSKATEFWARYVKTDTPPPPEGSKSYADYLARRFKKAVDTDDAVRGATVDRIVARLQKAEERERTAAYHAEKCRAELKAILGERSRCEGDWGHITWKNNRDSEKTDWRAVAMAAGVRQDTIAAHSRVVPGSRVFRVNWSGRGTGTAVEGVGGDE